jgi:peptidyl-prolyl cis-trans isomerase D
VLLVALAGAMATLGATDVFAREPDVIVVQHILIGFKKTVPDKPQERTKREARALADELVERAEAGEDFDALVKEYTNDNYPGVYKLTNTYNDAPILPDARRRDEMVSAFGDVAFRLEVGEIGVAKYNAISSPFGWHIIKRLE